MAEEQFRRESDLHTEQLAAWRVRFEAEQSVARMTWRWIIGPLAGFLGVDSLRAFAEKQSPPRPRQPLWGEGVLLPRPETTPEGERFARAYPDVTAASYRARAYWPELLFDGNRMADLNPHFVNYKTASPTEDQYPPDWDDRRERCLKRDNYRCRLCAVRKDLHVHHVIPISQLAAQERLQRLDQDRSLLPFAPASAPCLAFHSLQNLITLCKKCHEEQELYEHKRLIEDGRRRALTRLMEGRARVETKLSHPGQPWREGQLSLGLEHAEGKPYPVRREQMRLNFDGKQSPSAPKLEKPASGR